MKNNRFLFLPALALTVTLCGCGNRPPQHTGEGEVVIKSREVSLYRKKPYLLASKGRLSITESQLIFTPTPYYWVLYPHGTDAIVVSIADIQALQRKRWMLVLPFRFDVVTDDGNRLLFVTVHREKLVRELERLRVAAEE